MSAKAKVVLTDYVWDSLAVEHEILDSVADITALQTKSPDQFIVQAADCDALLNTYAGKDIVISGGSAGGNLTAAVALRIRDEGSSAKSVRRRALVASRDAAHLAPERARRGWRAWGIEGVVRRPVVCRHASPRRTAVP